MPFLKGRGGIQQEGQSLTRSDLVISLILNIGIIAAQCGIDLVTASRGSWAVSMQRRFGGG